jgi:hypothetical protein
VGKTCGTNREKRNVYRLLIGKPEGNRPLGRPRCMWIDNIKMDLLEIGLSVVDSIGMPQDRYRWRALVNAVMNLRIYKMLLGYKHSSYFTGDTLRLRYRVQPVNAI